MNEFILIYDFGLLDVIRRSLFVLIPFCIYALMNSDFVWFKSEKKSSYDVIKIKFIKFILILIGCLLFIIQVDKTYEAYYELNNNLKTVEGYVYDFQPMRSAGNPRERFKVNNILFEFSDYDESSFGYNTTKSQGGKIRNSDYIRIDYYNSESKNVILKLEKRRLK